MHTTDINSAVGCKFRSFTAHPGVFLRNFYYLILQCAVWLCGVVHIVELDSAVWCTSWRLTPRWDAQHRAWLCTMEFFEKFWLLDSAAVWYMPWSLILDSSVGCTPWSLTLLYAWHRRVRLLQKCQFFVFSYFLHLWKTFYRKTPEVTKIPCTICFYFHTIIFRQHRELTIVKLLIKKQTLLSGGQLEVKNLVTHSL